MNPYVTLCLGVGLVFVIIGLVTAAVGTAPWTKCEGTKKVLKYYITSIISMIIGGALIICALVAIDKEQTEICTGCGNGVRGTNYCTSCGSPVHKPESVYVCENCHKEIDTNYCGDCGGKKVLYIPIEVSPAD